MIDGVELNSNLPLFLHVMEDLGGHPPVFSFLLKLIMINIDKQMIIVEIEF